MSTVGSRSAGVRGGLVRKGRGAATCMQVPLAAPGIGRWCRLRGSWSRPPHSVAASDNPESPRCSSPLAAMLLESEVAGGMPWWSWLCRGSSCAPSLRRMLSACLRERVRRGGVYAPVLAPSPSLTRREGAIKHDEDSLFECCCLLLQDLCHGKARLCGGLWECASRLSGYYHARDMSDHERLCFTTSDK